MFALKTPSRVMMVIVEGVAKPLGQTWFVFKVPPVSVSHIENL